MSQVLVALRLDATPGQAFDVFVREIQAWWQPNDLFRFTPRPPGTLAFEPNLGGRFTESFADGEVFEIGRIKAWEPGKRLAFTWRQASFAPDQDTLVDIRFEAAGAQTRITVTHSGWDSVPQKHVARHGFPDAVFLQRQAEWWRRLLLRLAQAGAQQR